MNEKNYIMLKQRSWAKRNGHELLPRGIGSDKGARNYLSDIRLNLFEPLSEGSRASFEAGDGKEIKDNGKRRAKMKAVHSSAAIAVNLFQYWQGEGGARIPSLVRALMPAELLPTVKAKSFTSIGFEEKFKISDDEKAFKRSPNIDAVLHSKAYDIAVEAKFTEPYRKPYSTEDRGLKERYMTHPDISDLWKALPALHELAKEISPCDNKFSHLHAAQLVKHILGLKKNAGFRGFCLLYLWYDVFGEEGARHRAEIEQFAAIAKADGIQFGYPTYQEVIVRMRMTKKCYEGNEAYCDYMIDRYL